MTASSATTSTIRIPIESLQEVHSRASSLLFSVTRWGLVTLLLAAPLAFGAVQTWAWSTLLILSLALLLTWTIANARQGVLRIHWTPLYIPTGLFLAFCLFQYYGGFTLDRYATRNSIFSLVTDLLLFFLAGQLFGEAPKTAWQKLGLFVTLYAFSLGLFAILQYFSSHNLIYWIVKSPGWTFGPYVNHNDYAGLMEMLIPIAVAYVLSCPRSDHRRLLLAFSLTIPVASVLLSGSRGGFISLLAETLILAWILWRMRSGQVGGNFETMLALGITVVLLLFFWMAPNQTRNRLQGLANVTRTADVSYAQRKRVTLDTLHMFHDHPWMGTGLGSFETVFPQYQTFPSNAEWTHSHNDYAEALAETGLAGAALIILGLILFFKRTFKGFYYRLRNEVGWIQLGAAIGCCGLMVHSFADFNLHIPANAAWFAVCVAIATLWPLQLVRPHRPDTDSDRELP